MVMLVSLQQASDHLRRDNDDDDNDLILKIQAASRVVLNYLKDGATFLDSFGDVEVDSNDNPLDVPEEVQAATLLLIGDFYNDREGSNESAQWVTGNLPPMVVALLYPLRDPTLA